MNAHLFTADKGSKVCTECGKTRNAKAHKDARQATTVAEARQDLLPEVDAQVDDAEIADALEAAGIEVTEDEVNANAEALVDELLAEDFAEADAKATEDEATEDEAPAAKPAARRTNGDPTTASLWVGWRIADEVLGRDSSLAAKLQAAKPTGDKDRTVRLTVAELAELDTVAERFQKSGTTGPEIYSGRALRGRIAAALAKIEAATKENEK